MRKLNRLNQFTRLWQATQGKPELVTVGELAGHCFCSERHMRTLLRQFSDWGWLRWQSNSGRGKRGTLSFYTTPDAQRAILLEHALASGASDAVQALAQLAPEQLRQTLSPLMGGRWLNSLSTLRIPYYRPLDPLQPGFQAGRAEQHLASQVLSGLTRFVDNSDLPQPDMAHHWMVDEKGTEWRFFLRPTLRWHDGSRVSEDQLCHRLNQLIRLPLMRQQFLGVAAIDIPASQCLRIRLTRPDYWLPYRLASYCCRLAHPNDNARGCGPFRLTHQNNSQVRLECHESYHLTLPLLNAIEFWITPELFEQQMGTSCRHPVQIAVGEQTQMVALRPVSRSLSLGFCYLAIRPGDKLNTKQARYLMALIQHYKLVETLPLEASLISQSHAMLPGWPIPDYPLEPRVPLPAKMSLAYHLPIELHAMAQRLKEQLALEGCELGLHFYDAKSWEDPRQLHGIDLVMGDRLIGESPAWTLEQWLRCNLLWACLLPEQHRQQLQSTLDDVQGQPDIHKRESSLQQVMHSLMENGIIMPLFHYHYQISAPPGVNGISLNARGWFDFSQAWLPPPEPRGGEEDSNALP